MYKKKHYNIEIYSTIMAASVPAMINNYQMEISAFTL